MSTVGRKQGGHRAEHTLCTQKGQHRGKIFSLLPEVSVEQRTSAPMSGWQEWNSHSVSSPWPCHGPLIEGQKGVMLRPITGQLFVPPALCLHLWQGLEANWNTAHDCMFKILSPRGLLCWPRLHTQTQSEAFASSNSCFANPALMESYTLNIPVSCHLSKMITVFISCW